MFAEAVMHLNPLCLPLLCPAVITEQVVCRRVRTAEKICAQVVMSAALPVKSGFMGMENSILVGLQELVIVGETKLKQQRGDDAEAQDLGRLKEKWGEQENYFSSSTRGHVFTMFASIILKSIYV